MTLATSRLVANVLVDDLDAALDFYEGELGLPLVQREDVAAGFEQALFEVGGAHLRVAQAPGGGQSARTLVVFEVEDLERELLALRERGVAIEEYDLESLKTVDGIATIGSYRFAWVKDPTGNVLGLSERVR
jgi:catechol 2,3-dioxygenase-like lactoylglutathione lyase family enzyme